MRWGECGVDGKMGQKKTVVRHTPGDLTARGDGHIISASADEDEDALIAGQNGNSGDIVLYCQSQTKSGAVMKGVA